MMSVFNGLQLSVAAALGGAVLCGACPPEDGSAGKVEIRAVPARSTSIARPSVAVNPRIVSLAPQTAWAVLDDQDSKSVVKVVIVNENGELQYADENGQVKAVHNGEAIPQGRIQREAGVVRILGKDGGTLYEFHVARPVADGMIRAGETGLWRVMGDHGQMFLSTAAPARGRIGVYLGPTDESVRAEYGIESDSAVTITGTIEGSPAAEAGLQANDIVVRINGQTASEESLRSIVGETEPGQEVTLRIVRDGEARDLKVRVEAVEEAQVGEAYEGLMLDPEMMDDEFTFRFEGLDTRAGELHDHLLQLVPEGQWKEHIGNFDPEMLQQLHEKFGQGREFLELHVQPFLHRQHRMTEQAGPQAESIHQKVLEALKNAHLDLDDETRLQIHEAVKGALENARINLHDVEGKLKATDMPMIFDLMEKAEGDHVMVLPEGGRLRLMQPGTTHVDTVPGHNLGGGDAGDRLRRLEERLEKLEALLQQLVERQGSGGGRLP